MAKARHVPPSRKRYEERNPTVSARVSRELKEQLQETMEKTGKSFADVLKEGLRVQEPSAKEAYDRGYKAGHKAGKISGVAEGKKFYLGNCMYCRKSLYWDIARDSDRNLLIKIINESGLHHRECGS